MAIYDVFNGDADGITALIQMRLAQPVESQLITGVKRDIKLVKNINVQQGDQINVLDISLQKNHADVLSALEQGANIFYVDHHAAGDEITHANFTSKINTAPDVCTSLLINGHLKGAFPEWAIVGAFGDNLKQSAETLAKSASVKEADLELLNELGILVNYNAYGESLDDLHFKPDELYKILLQYSSPLSFIQDNKETFEKLKHAYHEDMQSAENAAAYFENENVAVFVLPEAAWARRINGVRGNALANQFPDRAHAVCVEKRDGTYTVSVRAPLNNKQGAGDFCAKFPGGGGREAAGGINELAKSDIDHLSKMFSEFYS